MNKKYIFIANWKLNKSYSESISWCQDREKLTELATTGNAAHEIVLCPTFPALAPMAKLLEDTGILLGAQNCSSHAEGAYTGEVSAKSLKEVGSQFCIIGHSERRRYFGENDIDIIQKAKLLLDSKITPILCTGEEKPFAASEIEKAIDRLLAPLSELPHKPMHNRLYIAYEPTWAIGTGKTPPITLLEEIAKYMDIRLKALLPNYQIKLLYGGSVDQNNIQAILTIPPMMGALIGGASLDFQNFKNIVCSI